MTIVHRSVKVFSRLILSGFVDELLSYEAIGFDALPGGRRCAGSVLSEANAWLITVGELDASRLKCTL